MKFLKITSQTPFLIILLLPWSLIQCSVVQESSSTMDPTLLITDDLRNLTESVWCNGSNYIAICQEESNLHYCVGEAFQKDFSKIENDTILQKLDKEKLGILLNQLNCVANESTREVVQSEPYSASFYWLIILCVFFFSVLCTMCCHVLCDKVGLYECCDTYVIPVCCHRHNAMEDVPSNLYY